MASYLTYTAYLLLSSTNKSEKSMTNFWDYALNPYFGHLILLKPGIMIFHKYEIIVKWRLLISSTIFQKIRIFIWPVSVKMAKNRTFDTQSPITLELTYFLDMTSQQKDAFYCL